MIRAQICLAWFIIGLCSATLAEPVKPLVVLDGLDAPCGVAVQPETGHVFVAESGAGRVVRTVNDRLEEVVVGFPVGELGMIRELPAGPLGLAFLTNRSLVIGGGGQSRGDEVIYVAQVPDINAPPCNRADAVRLGPVPTEKSKEAIGDFWGVVATQSAIYSSSGGDPANGWIVRLDVRDLERLNSPDSFAGPTRFVATTQASGVVGPAGITLSSRGELVVSQMGGIDRSRDSQLSFYRSTNGELLLNTETGLHDIVSVCYGATKAPSNKAQLYALDLAWSVPGEAGLFRLDAAFSEGRPTVKAVRIATLERPTAMALADNGSLYVTVLGANDGSGAKTGKLLRFEPGL